jgi:hypothetical protein
MATLEASIRKVGQAQPAFMIRRGKDIFEILEGHRRWIVIKKIDDPEVPFEAFVLESSEEALPFLIACIASGNRSPLRPLDMSRAIAHMYDDLGVPMKEIASKVFGISEGWANQLLSLRFLQDDVRDMVASNAIQPSHAIDLVRKYRFEPKRQLEEARRLIVGDITPKMLHEPLQTRGPKKSSPYVPPKTKGVTVQHPMIQKADTEVAARSGDVTVEATLFEHSAEMLYKDVDRAAGLAPQNVRKVQSSLALARRWIEQAEAILDQK